jgi:phosphoribosylglycinamide formyltransferase-1
MNYDNKAVLNRKIILLTYNAPHRKTYDVACLLKAKGFKNVSVFASDFHYVKKFKPLVEHRPPVINEIHPKDLASEFGYEFLHFHSLEEINPREYSDTIFLICGAGILPCDLVNLCKVVNAHPGILPYVRGLDALKWALYEEKPIGVTCHLASSEPDAGILISQKVISIGQFDSIESLGYKVYDQEVSMLVDAVFLLDSAISKNILIKPGDYIVHRRMPKNIECELIKKLAQRQIENLQHKF